MRFVSIPFSQALDFHLYPYVEMRQISFNSFQLGFRPISEVTYTIEISSFQFLLVRLQTGKLRLLILYILQVSIPFSQALDEMNVSLFLHFLIRFNSFQLGFRLEVNAAHVLREICFNSFQLGFRRKRQKRKERRERSFNSFQLGFRLQAPKYNQQLSIWFQFLLVRLQTRVFNLDCIEGDPFQFLLVRLQT